MGIWKISFNNLKVILFYASMFLLIMALSIKYNGLDVDLWARLIMGNHVFHKGLICWLVGKRRLPISDKPTKFYSVVT